MNSSTPLFSTGKRKSARNNFQAVTPITPSTEFRLNNDTTKRKFFHQDYSDLKRKKLYSDNGDGSTELVKPDDMINLLNDSVNDKILAIAGEDLLFEKSNRTDVVIKKTSMYESGLIAESIAEYSEDMFQDLQFSQINLNDSTKRKNLNLEMTEEGHADENLDGLPELFKDDSIICDSSSVNIAPKAANKGDNSTVLEDSALAKLFQDGPGLASSKFNDSGDLGNLSIHTDISFLLKRKLLQNASNTVTEKTKSTGWTQFQLEMSQSFRVQDSHFHEIGPYYGLPLQVKALVEKLKGITKFYEWQKECLNLPAVNERKNLVYALPTSGGKTLVAEILMLREVLCRRKSVLFVLPFVAIVQEKVRSLSPFAVELGFLVEEYAAGKGQMPPRKRRRKQTIFVATIEKALAVIQSLIEAERLSELGLVVVDELHLIAEGSGRGSALEALLTYIMHSKEKIHVVGMSATIGNVTELARFLKADTYLGSFRPVELTEFVTYRNNVYSVDWKEEQSLALVRSISSPQPGPCTMAPTRPTRLAMATKSLLFQKNKKLLAEVPRLTLLLRKSTMIKRPTPTKGLQSTSPSTKPSTLSPSSLLTAAPTVPNSSQATITSQGFRQG